MAGGILSQFRYVRFFHKGNQIMSFVFDANNVGGTTEERLKGGQVLVFVCKEAKLKQTNAGDGSYVNIRCEVAEGPHKGKTVYNRFTYANKSAKATEIGHKQLAQYCVAIGKQKISDIVQLEGVPFVATIKETESMYQGEMRKQFELEKFEVCDSQTAARVNAQAVLDAQAAQASNEAPF
jgi:hypothetical protein